MGAVAVDSGGDLGTSFAADGSARTTLLVGALLIAAFTSLGLHQVVINSNPEAYDQDSYLQEAVRIKERGGVLAFPEMILDGEFRQANQHPLYILSITPFASHDISALVAAKLVSLFFGVVTILLGYLLIMRAFDPLVAALASLGFLLTHLYIQWSAFVACESLLVLLSTVAIYGILRGFTDAKYWTMAGFFAGLAYFTKVTALLLLPGLAVAALVVYGRQLFRQAAVYKFCLAFLLGCSPLLVNNTIVHGVPIYNVNIANLFGSSASLAYSEKSMALGNMIRVYEDQSASSTLEQPSEFDAFGAIANVSGDIASRLPGELMMFLETLSVWPLHKGPAALRILFGAAILALCLLGASRERVFGARVYFLSTLLVFLVALSMHRPLPRYWLPILYFVWVYAAVGGLYLLSRLTERAAVPRERVRMIAMGAVIACCALLSIFTVATKPLDRVTTSAEVPEYRQDLLNWLRANLREEDRFVEGPLFVWQLERGAHLYPPLDIRQDQERFHQFLREYDVSYVVVDWESMNSTRYRGSQARVASTGESNDRRAKFAGIVDFDQELGILERNVPPEWERVAADEKGRVEYIVYRVGEPRRAAADTSATGA